MLVQLLTRFLPLTWRIRFRDRQAKRAQNNYQQPAESVFSEIYAGNKWGNAETVSGPGSQKEVTQPLIAPLNDWMNRLNVYTLLDLPCGDSNWIFALNLENRQYIGGDIVQELIEQTRLKHAAVNRQFQVLDVIKDQLPAADLLLCRDCFVHLSNDLVLQALLNISTSDVRYVALTHFPDFPRNYDIQTGQWRPINLQLPPYNLPKPEAVIEEWSPEGIDLRYRKVLALWRVDTLTSS